MMISDGEWTERVKEMFDQRFMPDQVDVPMDLLGVIEPPEHPCPPHSFCEDFAA